MEKEEQPILSDSDNKFERSVIRKERIYEMLKGIFIGFGYVILALILILTFGMATKWWAYVAAALIYIGGIIYFFLIKRKFLAIGLIFLVTVPPAVIGGCIFITSSPS